MKLLIVGNDEERCLESIYFHCLRSLNQDVTLFNIVRYVNYGKLGTRIRNRLYDRSIFKKANAELIKYVNAKKPDAIWIFKGVEIDARTLEVLKSAGIKLVNYNPDHPFIRTAVAHGGKNIEYSVPLYDLHFCYSKMLVRQISTEYRIKAVHLPFGYDISENEYDSIITTPEENSIAFVGTPDDDRKRAVTALMKAGLKVRVYGERWRRYIGEGSGDVEIRPAVNGMDFWRAMRRHKVQLNVFRAHNVTSHNMRSFEVPAVGGIQLAPASEEHGDFFEVGKEIFLYENMDQLIDLAKILLKFSKEETDLLRAASRRRCIEGKYSYQERAKIVVDALNSI